MPSTCNTWNFNQLVIGHECKMYAWGVLAYAVYCGTKCCILVCASSPSGLKSNLPVQMELPCAVPTDLGTAEGSPAFPSACAVLFQQFELAAQQHTQPCFVAFAPAVMAQAL